jgi:hypothetical protein
MNSNSVLTISNDPHSSGDWYSVNENFDHKLFRVKVPIIALKKEEIKDIVVRIVLIILKYHNRL